MAEPTSTRAELRRALCQALQMPFYKRTNGQSTVGASPTTTTIVDTALVQEDDQWNGQWWYSITNQESRKIIATTKSNNTIKLEYPVTLPIAGQAYEIHSIFNAYDLHAAINRAIEDSFPAFFDYVSNESLVVCENKLKYAISGFALIPWHVHKVWVEHSDSQIFGTVTSAASTSLTDTTADFSDVEPGWMVSIYAGTGANQTNTVFAGSTATTLNLTTAWSPIPDTTSKYCIWNPNSETNQWEQVVSADFDAKEYPNYLYFTKPFPNSLGLRIRIDYTSRPPVLATETANTCVPKEYIIHKALSILFGMKVNDNRADRNRYANLEEYQRQLAEQYKAMRAFQMPETTIWRTSEVTPSSFFSSQETPF